LRKTNFTKTKQNPNPTHLKIANSVCYFFFFFAFTFVQEKKNMQQFAFISNPSLLQTLWFESFQF